MKLFKPVNVASLNSWIHGHSECMEWLNLRNYSADYLMLITRPAQLYIELQPNYNWIGDQRTMARYLHRKEQHSNIKVLNQVTPRFPPVSLSVGVKSGGKSHRKDGTKAESGAVCCWMIDSFQCCHLIDYWSSLNMRINVCVYSMCIHCHKASGRVVNYWRHSNIQRQSASNGCVRIWLCISIGDGGNGLEMPLPANAIHSTR